MQTTASAERSTRASAPATSRIVVFAFSVNAPSVRSTSDGFGISASCAGAAATISLVIAVLFVSAYIETRIGTFVAVLWVLTIGLLIVGLGHFLRETLMAANGPDGRG